MDASIRSVLDRSPRFLLAKFTPDLRRMEPRNIGLVGWADGKVVARFLGENGQGPGRVTKIPKRLEPCDRDLFEQWLRVWRHHISRGEIRACNGSIVSVDSPAFLDALREQSKRSFRLVDSVTLMDEISADELPEVLDDLFEELVVTDEDRRDHDRAESEAVKLKKHANAIFKAAGLYNRHDFHRDASLSATVDSDFDSFNFDYYIGNGTPKAVYQRVAIGSQPSVTNAAYTLEWIGKVPRFQHTVRRASLVELNGHANEPKALFALRELRKHSDDVIDVTASDAPARILALTIPFDA